MKIVGMTLPYSGVSWERALHGLAQAGYSHIGFGLRHQGAQIPDPTWSDEQVKALAHQIEEHGLKPCVMFAAVRVLEPGGVEAFKRRIDTAQQLGVKIITSAGVKLDLNSPNPGLRQEALERHREYVKRMQVLGDYAADRNVIIALKPHGDNIGTAQQLVRVLSEIDRRAVRAFYDPGNVRYYEGLDPAVDITVITGNMPIICAKDHRGEQLNSDFPVPGEGDVDFVSIFTHLKAIGFAGYVTVERVDGSTTPEHIDQRMRQARANVEQIARSCGLAIDTD